MVAVYSSALSGVACNPALPTRLLLRLPAHDENGGDGPPRPAVQRAGLPEAAVSVKATGGPRLPLPRLREALGLADVAHFAAADPALPESDMAAVLDAAGVGA